MKPDSLFDGAPAKVVGRRVRSPSLEAAARGGISASRAWAAAGFASRVPKGVFRFHTHEEADRWMMDQLARKTAD